MEDIGLSSTHLELSISDLSSEDDLKTVTDNLKNKPDEKNENVKTIQDVKKLHESIEKGNFEDVKNFCEKYLNERLCDANNVCALELAIDHEKFDIYAYLRAKGFYTDKGAQLYDKIEKLSEDQKQNIRQEILKHVQGFPNAFIGILTSRCMFDACSSVSSTAVRKMLTELSSNDELKPFLQIASQIDLKIIFDFATESVRNMDPSTDEHVMGMAYYMRGILYIGRDRNKKMRYGTFMHELTHLVLYKLYENECLPYCKDDIQRENEWSQILKNEEEKYQTNPVNVDDVIRLVFQYYKKGYEQLAELAVRPNHIMAQYFNDPGKIQEVKQIHDPVFQYFQNYVLQDLQVPNVLRLIKLNNDFEVFDSIKKCKLELQSIDNAELVNQEFQKILVTSNVPKLTMLKLHQEINNATSRKIDLKVKNIFVDVKKFVLISLKNEFEELVETSNIDRIIFDATNSKKFEKTFEYLKNFNSKPKIFVICHESDVSRLTDLSDFQRIFIQFRPENLKTDSNRKLLERQVSFQDKTFKAEIFLHSVSIHTLPILCSNDNIVINFDENLKSVTNFIPRIVERDNRELNLNDFIVNVQRDQIVIISDVAGNGKTTLLQKIGKIFLSQYPKYWISFVSLRNILKQLNESSFTNFDESFRNILNLSPFDQEIFTQKFANGEAKILFDGFDEISPNYKDEALMLFKLFKAQQRNQIFITTRRHLEHNLESELEVKSYKIKNLSDEDQVTFLCNSWKKSHSDSKFIETCARQLTQKLSEMVKDYPNLIGIPLIIRCVAKLYVDEINEEFSGKIKNLKLSKVYIKIFEECLNVLNKNQPTNATKRLSPLQVFEYFAVVFFFGRDIAKDLKLIHNIVEWPIEEVSRYGILSYNKDEKIFFNHLTYGEHLLSNLVVSNIQHYDELTEAHLKLIFLLLSDEKYKISQIFLDEMLEDVKRKNLQIFHCESDLKLFDLIANRKLPNLFRICLSSDLKDLCSSEEIAIKYILAVANDDEAFESFTSVVQNHFDKNFGKALMHQNQAQETILHLCVENFSVFEKICKWINKSCADVVKDLVKLKDSNGRNILMTSTFCEHESSFRFILDFIGSFMNKNEIENLLNESDNDKNNIFHLAASNLKSRKTFEFLWEKVCEVVPNSKEFLKQPGNKSNSILHSACLNQKSWEILPLIFEIIESFCDDQTAVTQTWKKMVINSLSTNEKSRRKKLRKCILEMNSEKQNLLCLAANFAIQANLEFLINKTSEIFDENEVKNMLKTTKGYKSRNLLSEVVQNTNEDSVGYLFKLFEQDLIRHEIFELFCCKDKDGDNVLHLAASFLKSKNNFMSLFDKVCDSFNDPNLTSEEQTKRMREHLKCKGSNGRNILLQSIVSKNESAYFHIFEKILAFKVYDFKDYVSQSDVEGENFLHKLAQFGSLSMLEFAFERLENKLSVEEELKSILKAKSDHKNNILHCAAIQNTNLEVIQFLIAKIEKLLGKVEPKKNS